MLKTTFVLLTVGTAGLFNVVADFQSSLPSPVEIRMELSPEDQKLADTKKALTLLGRDVSFAKDVYYTATAKNIDPVLWTCVVETESEFKRTAKSSKNYKGLAQTPKAVCKLGYDMVDLAAGACILREKLQIANGDMRKAMALYKGGNNPAAKKEADKVFKLYAKLKQQIKEG